MTCNFFVLHLSLWYVGSSNKLIFGGGTGLSVTPKTERTVPSVYKLESSKQVDGLPDSVCLVTDFPFPNTTLKLDGSKTIDLNTAALLDKSENHVWRYSTVVWDNDNPSKNLSCNMEYNAKPVYPDTSTDVTTQQCLSIVPENFKAGISLNSLSFSVFGLRFLTIKGILFNVITTIKLWSF